MRVLRSVLMWEFRAPTSEKEVLGIVAKPSRRAEGWIWGSAERKSDIVVDVVFEIESSLWALRYARRLRDL